MADYRVHLDIFAGPLDLLLYLVRKEEVDIYDIPIARVTEQYLQYIEMLRQFDIDLAGDFLVMAAALMEIKSAMLLPRTEETEQSEEEAHDPRTELVRQLLEYKRFKDAANLLEESAENRQQRFTRPDTVIDKIEPEAEPELDMDQVSIWTLLEAFDNIMQATGRYQSYDHITDETPIDLYQIEILHRLQSDGPMTFQNLFKGRENRVVMVGMFLAILELVRNQLIWAQQTESEGAIYIRANTDKPAEQAVQDAIFAREEPSESAGYRSALGNQVPTQTDDLVEETLENPDENEDFSDFAKHENLSEQDELSSREPDNISNVEHPRIPITEYSPILKRSPSKEKVDR